MRLLGSAAPDAGGVVMAARRAGAAGMRALQVFRAPPTYYNERVSIRPDRAAQFQQALDAAGISPRHVIVHAGYVLNTASPEPEKAARARTALAKELERSTALGTGGFCFHPGSAAAGDPDAASDQVGDAIRFALEAIPETASRTRVLIENTAGAGQTMGRSPGEIGRMLKRVPDALRPRTGYGLDTCHLFASGHAIQESPRALSAVLDAFEQATGEPPAFFHLNDSQHPFGSNKDRHALLGEGMIGIEPFRWLLAEPRAAGIPLILETPHERKELADDDPTPDPYDVRMMALLKGMLEG